MFAVLLFAFSLIAGHLGTHQQFDPRERFEVPARVRLSQRVMRSLMENQVVPNYPKDARKKRIHGTVILMLAVDEKGRVSGAEVIAGDPLLATSTVEAVKKVHFRPYYLNGEAVATEGQISYLFKCLPKGRATVSLVPLQ